MHRMQAIIGWIVIACLLLTATPVSAQAPNPHVLGDPPHPPTALGPPPTIPTTFTISSITLPGLKAVLIAGEIDGATGSWTLSEVHNLQRVASLLRDRGVEVHEFYPPNNHWSDIQAAANGAHFLLYRGHGVYWPYGEQTTYGGFYLGSGEFVSNDQIRALNLNPNAIVLLYGCFTAGSSSDDPAPISGSEARSRVTQYSGPFFDVGAAGYFANWYPDAFDRFLTYLFNNETLGGAYEHVTRDYNGGVLDTSRIERSTLSLPAGSDLWLGKTWLASENGYQYDNAFAGLSNRTLPDLFAPHMVLSPSSITLLVESGAARQTYRIQVRATNTTAFNWTVTTQSSTPSWLDDYSPAGSNTQPILLSIQPPNKVGTYSTTLLVNGDPVKVQNASQQVNIQLVVVENEQKVYMPYTARR